MTPTTLHIDSLGWTLARFDIELHENREKAVKKWFWKFLHLNSISACKIPKRYPKSFYCNVARDMCFVYPELMNHPRAHVGERESWKNQIFRKIYRNMDENNDFYFSCNSWYRSDLSKSARNREIHPLGSIIEKSFEDDFSDDWLRIFQIRRRTNTRQNH